LLHKEDANQADYAIFTIRLQRSNSEKLLSISTDNCVEPPDEETARGIIDKLFSLTNVTT
jgi:hypothetical protein